VAKLGSSFSKFVFWHGNHSAAIPSITLTLKALVTLCITRFYLLHGAEPFMRNYQYLS